MTQGCNTSNNDESKEARYANYFKVGHNAFEFILDFGQLYSENAGIVIHTRIVTSPVYAMELLHTLQKGIKQFEATYGIILDEEFSQRE